MKKTSFILFLILFPLFLPVLHSAPRTKSIQDNSLCLQLYYLPWCPYCQKVSNYLEKIHKTIPSINLQKNPEARAELIRIGGKGQVPCLVINGHALYESDAIIRWISENKDRLPDA